MVGEYRIHYYHNNGELIGFHYSDAETEEDYFYGKINNGEIRYLYNSAGEIVASYTYNAWGYPVSITGSETWIARKNPIRYKDYYFDFETGLYYVYSRYYDPEIGRFLNADDVDYLGIGGIVANNLFVFCENNAINNSDPDGHAPFLGWGVQLEGSFMGISGGIELVWYKSIAKSVYGSRNLPCVYGYLGFSYNFKGSNVWHIKSLLEYVKDTALRAFGSAKKAAWKIGGGLSLCAFLVYGTINHPKEYTGPFITTGGTLFHIKGYYSRSPQGNVYCWGLGVSSSKFGFSPLSVSAYEMLPANVVISIADVFSSLFSKIKAITNLI